jgi:hypothetical protein
MPQWVHGFELHTGRMTASLKPVHDLQRIAVAAYLTGYQGQSRIHAESDLNVLLRWYRERDLDPWAFVVPMAGHLSAGCKRSAGSIPPQSPAACQWRSASAGPA